MVWCGAAQCGLVWWAWHGMAWRLRLRLWLLEGCNLQSAALAACHYSVSLWRFGLPHVLEYMLQTEP